MREKHDFATESDEELGFRRKKNLILVP